MTEKLALSRELSVIKPEFEHVKSQLSHQQSVIAEKHALERQLNSLEVELEAEKRSKQRAQKDDETDELQTRIQELEKKLAAEKKDKERVRKETERALAEAASQHDDNGESYGLQAKVQELEKKLASEKKDKVRVQKEGERALAEATAQHEVFEERLETMKAKLRETRDELKKCQAELSRARSASTIPDAKERAGARKQLKRSIEATTTADVTIDTPHADEEKVKKALKRRGLDQTVTNMGEKSAFSITPFLNRSKGLEESLDEADLDADQSYVPQSKRVEPSPVQDEPQPDASEEEAAPEPGPKPKPRGRPRKVLGEISTAKNSNAAKRSQGKVGEKAKATKLDVGQGKVDEESPQDNAENRPASPPAEESEKAADEVEEAPAEKPKPTKRAPIRKLKTAKQADDSVMEPEPKKKKRKLLGGPKSTLFDDEEGEPAAAKKPASGGKVSLAPARKLGAVGAVKRDAFAGKSFSPLKRDRRGVHASFLA